VYHATRHRGATADGLEFQIGGKIMASSMFGRTRVALPGGIAALVFSAAAAAQTVSLNYFVTNDSGTTQTYNITETLGGITFAGPLLLSGSISGTVTDLDGDTASASSLLGGSIYTAMIDGNDVFSLMTGYSFSAPGPFLAGSSQPQSFSAFPLFVGMSSSISIHLEFELSAGDSVNFASVFTVIPAPAAFAVLSGLTGLAGLGRRRRA